MIIEGTLDVVNNIPTEFIMERAGGIIDNTIALGMGAIGAGIYGFLK